MLTNSKTSLLLILLQQHSPVMTGILYGQCLITAGLIMTGLFASQLSKRIVTSPSLVWPKRIVTSPSLVWPVSNYSWSYYDWSVCLPALKAHCDIPVSCMASNYSWSYYDWSVCLPALKAHCDIPVSCMASV